MRTHVCRSLPLERTGDWWVRKFAKQVGTKNANSSGEIMFFMEQAISHDAFSLLKAANSSVSFDGHFIDHSHYHMHLGMLTGASTE